MLLFVEVAQILRHGANSGLTAQPAYTSRHRWVRLLIRVFNLLYPLFNEFLNTTRGEEYCHDFANACRLSPKG